MRCYYVMVHGRLNWLTPEPDEPGARPLGIYCHRYVLARDEASAERTTFERVLRNLSRTTGWGDRNEANLTLEMEDIYVAPFHRLLLRDNRGHSFYAEDDS